MRGSMTTGEGWCVLCNGPNETGACVGCGDGTGNGEDGRFAHVECYRTAKRIEAFVRGFDSYVADDLASFIVRGRSCIQPWERRS